MSIHDELAARGVGIAAISVDEREDSVGLAERLRIQFPLLSDQGLKVASAYGVAMKGRDIAVPATFVVLPGGATYWRKVGESMTDRPTRDEILGVVDQAIREPDRR